MARPFQFNRDFISVHTHAVARPGCRLESLESGGARLLDAFELLNFLPSLNCESGVECSESKNKLIEDV